MSGELKQWLEGLGIDALTADRYVQGLAHPDFLYTQVSQLVSDPLSHEDLIRAGVNALLHRNRIIRAVQEKKQATAIPQATGASLALSNEENEVIPGKMSIRLEGLKTTPWKLNRHKLCEDLCTLVDTHSLLLVRAPFASGKTSLAQLLHQHLRTAKTAYVVTLAEADVSSWSDCWFQQTGTQWKDVKQSAGHVYVIIDEVQDSYPETSKTHNLWKDIKGLGARAPSVRFICIGSYGDPMQASLTPIEFPVVVTLHPHKGSPGLTYTHEEYQELCEVFAAKVDFRIDERSANYIFHLTGGHPGIIGVILRIVHHHSKDLRGKGKVADKDLYTLLHSAQLHDSLQYVTCRAIPNFDDSMKDVCMRVLGGASFKAPKNSFANGDEQQTLKGCLKASILVEDGDSVTFASPVIRNRALAYYYSSQNEPESLDAFIVDVVQRFSPAQLREIESKDIKSRIMEAQWQQEFHRAAASLLPSDAIISPEYGREQGANGQVDFYILKYKWMIEVLREGIDMAKHERRFDAGGQYAPLINGGDWCVVDFRATEKQVRRRPQPHTYHVSFKKDRTGFKIYKPSGEKQEFRVLGDKVAEVKSDRQPGETPVKPPPPK